MPSQLSSISSFKSFGTSMELVVLHQTAEIQTNIIPTCSLTGHMLDTFLLCILYKLLSMIIKYMDFLLLPA